MASRRRQPQGSREEAAKAKSAPSLSETDWRDVANAANRPGSIPENADFRYDVENDEVDGSEPDTARTRDEPAAAAESVASRVSRDGKDGKDRA